MAFARLTYRSLFAVGLLFAALHCAAGIPGCALVRELPDARRGPLPLAAPFAALPCAAGIPGWALVRELPDARRGPLPRARGLPRVPGLNLLEQFIHIQVLWAIVKKVKQALGASVDVAGFFKPAKVLERLSLYTCTVVVDRLIQPPTVCQFIMTQAVLAAWLVCMGNRVAPAFEWWPVLERFSVYLLLRVPSTMLKSPDNDVILRHN